MYIRGFFIRCYVLGSFGGAREFFGRVAGSCIVSGVYSLVGAFVL